MEDGCVACGAGLGGVFQSFLAFSMNIIMENVIDEKLAWFKLCLR